MVEHKKFLDAPSGKSILLMMFSTIQTTKPRKINIYFKIHDELALFFAAFEI